MSALDRFDRNHPAPSVNPLINRVLGDIARTPSGLPVFRLVWGQDWEPYGHVWTYRGEVAHRYRHHWEYDYVLAEPVYDLVTGQCKGYGKMYRYADVIPADPLLVPRVLKKSIGVPRWYFEIGMPVDEQEWESQRYADDGSDETGEPPEGLVEYAPLVLHGLLMRFETHLRDMSKWVDEEIPSCCADRKKIGKKCYGTYRAPTMTDVQMVQRAWSESKIQHGFFEKPHASQLAWMREESFKEHEREEVKKDAQHADDMEQAMSMLSEGRLLGDGSGMDLNKYKFVPRNDALPEHKPNIMEK